MITIEKLRNITDIFSHESCPDGLSAALICKKAFGWLGISPKIHFLQYDTEFMEKLEVRPNQMFVDITPPKSRWEEWKAANPIVLDHHDTAKHIVEGLGGVFGDTNESGASLAFKHVYDPISSYAEIPFNGNELQRFAHLSMIRDTWKKNHELWPDAMALAHALMFYGSKELLENPRSLDELLSIGRTISTSIEAKSKKYSRGSSFETLTQNDESIRIGYFNCTEKLTSDAANYLIDNCGCDVAVGYFFLFEDGKTSCVVSLRSNGKVLVNKIAELGGGGGHPRAAGYRLQGDDISPHRISISVSDLLCQSHWEFPPKPFEA